MPYYKDGNYKTLQAFFSKNITYPDVAIQNQIKGEVFVKVLVKKDGTLDDNISVLRGITDCPECNMAVIDAVKKFTLWTPGKQKGEVVKCYYNIKVKFEPKKTK